MNGGERRGLSLQRPKIQCPEWEEDQGIAKQLIVRRRDRQCPSASEMEKIRTDPQRYAEHKIVIGQKNQGEAFLSLIEILHGAFGQHQRLHGAVAAVAEVLEP